MIEAILLDFYGTVVHEDDEVISEICEIVQASSQATCVLADIAAYWWRDFSGACANSRGPTFKPASTWREPTVAQRYTWVIRCRAMCGERRPWVSRSPG